MQQKNPLFAMEILERNMLFYKYPHSSSCIHWPIAVNGLKFRLQAD